MLQAVQLAGRLKPELRLAQAISEFEASLSDQQKALFRTQKSKHPDTNDVMRLTAEIDRSSRGSVRSYGPRWTSFLEGVQRFASIGDIIIGGSQYLPACGVWTVVRSSLLTVAGQASYMDQLSKFFMQLGRSAPRYQNMASLWPKFKTLQTCLIEYHIVVTQLCHHIFKICNQPLLKQLITTMQGPLASFQSSLEIWANAIRDEIHIQTSQLIKSEAEESKQFRESSRNLVTMFRKNQARVSKHDFLDRISKYDYRTPWKQIRKCGNTTFLRTNQEYAQWLTMDDAVILSVMGKLGSGKSVLLANMIDDIVLARPQIPIAYFFCRHDTMDSLRVETVCQSIIRQLLEQILKIDWNPEDLGLDQEDLLKRYIPFEMEELSAMLQKGLRGRAYIVLDGLDECVTQVKGEILKYFYNIQAQHNISLCLSSRQDLATMITSRNKTTATVIKMSMPRENPDIETFIDAELRDRLAFNELIVRNLDIIPMIRNALLGGSQGMFLWVVLQIKSLCLMESDYAILEAIKDLPDDLPKTYRRLLQYTKTKHQQDLRARIFEWVLTSKRPLTTDELSECLSISPGDLDLDTNKIVNDVQATISYCGGLINISEENSTIHLVHPSVEQFVLSEDRATYPWAVDLAKAQAYTAVITLTYLNLRIFEVQLVKHKKRIVDTNVISGHIINSVAPPKSMFGRFASSLRVPQQTSTSYLNITPHIVDKASGSGTPDYKFREYAVKYLFHHLVDVEEFTESLRSLLMLALEGNRTNINQLDEDRSLWATIASHDNVELMNIICQFSAVDPWPKMLPTTLVTAIKHGSIKILDQAFKIYEPPLNLADGQYRRLLHYAALYNQPDVIDFLFQSPNGGILVLWEVDIYDDTAMHIAARNGFLEVIERLFRHSTRWSRADRSIWSRSTIFHSVIQEAAMEGHTDIVKILLDNTPDTVDQSTSIQMVLLALVKRKHADCTGVETMKTFLDGNMEYSSIVRPALKAAIKCENLADVQCLLPRYGDDYSDSEVPIQPLLIWVMYELGQKSNQRKTILAGSIRQAHTTAETASQEKVRQINQLLLETPGINLSFTNHWYIRSRITRPDGRRNGTLLHLAADKNCHDIVDALLASNWINVDAMSDEGLTALDIARKRGHKKIVIAIEIYSFQRGARQSFPLVPTVK